MPTYSLPEDQLLLSATATAVVYFITVDLQLHRACNASVVPCVPAETPFIVLQQLILLQVVLVPRSSRSCVVPEVCEILCPGSPTLPSLLFQDCMSKFSAIVATYRPLTCTELRNEYHSTPVLQAIFRVPSAGGWLVVGGWRVVTEPTFAA